MKCKSSGQRRCSKDGQNTKTLNNCHGRIGGKNRRRVFSKLCIKMFDGATFLIFKTD